MKKRIGFVSNSSSASFLIADPKIKTIDVAFALVMDNDQDDSFEWISDIKKRQTIVRCIRNRLETVRGFKKDNPDYDGNILIPWTSNGDSRIYRNEKGNIACETTRNISFDKVGDLPILQWFGDDGPEGYEDEFDQDRRWDRIYLDFATIREVSYDEWYSNKYR